MEVSQRKKDGSFPRRRSVLIAARTFDVNETLSEKLRGFSAKMLAMATGASPRTTKGWLHAESGPIWKHTVQMLNDDELCVRLLEAAGRGDLAKSADTIAKLRAALGAVEGK